MSKAPAMPMYWDAYLADTTHLTTEEHGAYMLLLAAMWRRNGSVPDDDKDNARILGLTRAKWLKTKARLASTIAGFEVSDGIITQEKLQKTWKITQEMIERNRSNGAKGGRPKVKENKDLGKANGSVSDNPNESIPEPEPEPLEEESKASSSKGAADYLEYLKVHPRPTEGPAGERAFDSLVAAGEDPKAIIAAARAYSVEAGTFSTQKFVQQSDNFLDPERGKWRAFIPKQAGKKPTEAEVMDFYAKVVLKKSPSAASTVSLAMAQKLLSAKLVTEQQLKDARVDI